MILTLILWFFGGIAVGAALGIGVVTAAIRYNPRALDALIASWDLRCAQCGRVPMAFKKHDDGPAGPPGFV